MTFRAFCRAVALVDGPFQYTSTVLNDPRARDFLADAMHDQHLPEPICWLELREYVEPRHVRGALLGACLVYRDYRRHQHRGYAA